MPGTIQDFASTVDNLIATCRDAEQGFRGAADSVNDPALRERFARLSAERGRYAAEIQEALRAMGFEPANPSGVSGTLHGGWMALKGVFTGHSPHAILVETERGEDKSMNAYRQALSVNLPDRLRSVIENQFSQVQQDHAQIRTLRDQTAPSEETPTSAAEPRA
jgi:uncharacterized protein (TIGR02284 family)